MMKRVLKQNGKRAIAFLAGIAAFLLLPVCPVFAAGDVYVSDTYIEIAEGETVTISLTADGAAGFYSLSADGPVSAGGGGWLEDESASISITGTGVGSGTVTISLDDMATTDEEDLSGTTLTVEVVVKEPEGGYSGGDKGKEDREDIEKETDEEEQEDEEETTKAPKKVSKRSVTINKRNYTLLNNLTGVKIPAGFETKEETWNGEKILVLTYGDELVFYVLQREDDGKIVFREYDEASKTFLAPRTIVQNKAVYYVLDAKGEKLSEHLTQKDLTVNDFEVKGYVSDDKALSDLVYLRILTDGKEGIYTFDQKEGSLQRCLSLNPDAEKELRSEVEKAQEELQKAKKDLQLYKILLAVAGVLIVGLVIALVLGLERKKDRARLAALYPTETETNPQAPVDRATATLPRYEPQSAPEPEKASVSEPAGSGPLNLKPLDLKPLNSETAKPSVPAAERPSVPAAERPSVPAATRPSAPAPERPSVPAPERPIAPAAARPSAPAAARPSVPAAERPTAPAPERPSVPTPERPSAPAAERPSAPAAERPSVPAAERPSVPAAERPSAPAAERPSAPAAERPSAPEPEKPYKPELNIPELKFSDEEFRNL